MTHHPSGELAGQLLVRVVEVGRAIVAVHRNLQSVLCCAQWSVLCRVQYKSLYAVQVL